LLFLFFLAVRRRLGRNASPYAGGLTCSRVDGCRCVKQAQCNSHLVATLHTKTKQKTTGHGLLLPRKGSRSGWNWTQTWLYSVTFYQTGAKFVAHLRPIVALTREQLFTGSKTEGAFVPLSVKPVPSVITNRNAALSRSYEGDGKFAWERCAVATGQNRN
ncbi:unnamed protein product, partial [Ixodes pacificus]